MEKCFNSAQCSERPTCRLCAAQRTMFWAQLCRALGSPATGTCSYSSSSGTKGCIFVPTAVCARQRNGEMHPTHSCASPSDPHFSPRDCPPRFFWDALLVLDYPTRCSLLPARGFANGNAGGYVGGVSQHFHTQHFSLHRIALCCKKLAARHIRSANI
jgi:hypothetical protein